MYQVQELVGKKYLKNKVFYKVKWRGYPMDQCTWEKESHLKYVKDLIQLFQEKQTQINSEQVTVPCLEGQATGEETRLMKKNEVAEQDHSIAIAISSKSQSKEKISPVENKTRRKKRSQSEEQNDQTKNIDQIPKGTRVILKKQTLANKVRKQRDRVRDRNRDKEDRKKQRNLSLEETNEKGAQNDKEDHGESETLEKQSEEILMQNEIIFKNFAKSLKSNQQEIEKTEENNQLFKENVIKKIQENPKMTKMAQKTTTISPQTASSPELSLYNLQTSQQDVSQNPDQSKSVYTLSSNTSTSYKKQLKNKLREKKNGNLKIKLLETQDNHTEIREYLVENEDGRLKIFSSIELLVAHPLEFIIYLQGRAYNKK